MATQVRRRRGTSAEIAGVAPAEGELFVNTDDHSIHVGDGVKLGGYKIPAGLGGAANIVDFGARKSSENNAIAIQAAIDSIGSDGGAVLVPEGGFYLTGSFNLPSNKRVKFIGGTLKIIDGNNAPLISCVNPLGIEIDSLTIIGNSANQSPPAVKGESAAIDIRGAGSEVFIHRCEVLDCIDAGIIINDADGVTITDNSVLGVNFHGIQTAGTCTNVVISGNRVKDVIDGAGIIPMGSATHVSVTGNVIEGVSGEGGDAITCYSNTNQHITISGNICKTIEGHGIHAGGKYLSITGNVIDQASAAGIYVRSQNTVARNVSVTGNTIYAATTTPPNVFAIDGIYINQVSGFSVSGNEVNDAQDVGLHFKQCSAGIVSGNTVLVSVGEGIWSEVSGTRINYTGNLLKDCGRHGALFDNEGQGSFVGNMIENYATTDATAYGIRFLTGTLMQVDNNSIRVGVSTIAPVANSFDPGALGLSTVQGNIITDGLNIRGGSVVASATITALFEYDLWLVSGSTEINSITTNEGYPGRVITLEFSDPVTVKNLTGNLNLAGGDFVATAGDILVLAFRNDTTGWNELSRSSN